MTTKNVLITGGAGFIGGAVAQRLVAAGHAVTILDNFSEQVHDTQQLPQALADAVTLIRADVRDANALREAIRGQHCIVHLAAETGTGQSMYRIEHYFDVNVQATATLLDILQNDPDKSLETLVVASSRAIYGEGAYACAKHGTVYPAARGAAEMAAGQFDPLCPRCGGGVTLVPTSETAPFSPSSFYGLTKQVQEQAVLLFAQTRNINGFALRYQNVYGPGQSLQNPYTGILAVFSNLARQGKDIEIYEDGAESRDFVYIDDIAEVTARCVEYDNRFVGAVNVGSGVGTDVLTVASRIATFFDSPGKIVVTGAYRIGDIRHNVADVAQLEALLDIRPATPFEAGLEAFLSWAQGQNARDKTAYDRSVGELRRHNLLIDTRSDGG
ncbi:SDR family NAD(P)-dependent oxidoreductase [Sphingomonas sp. BT-65]|uniref:NAD-dependent epimerase/dehydratase family protein n=1 Tax=Sphingomonas sp. BT-65 TaxID=2989821 RepID=UPI002236592A|nr:SDR family NAD(P)-dependent oxidoreductase [Sphingomonas sp. BT-65]MCW4461891.1 SDR family NAD(P)-dependent oxidoreductase [Sphingomonas sp. BT-65]